MKFVKWMNAGALGVFLVSANPAATQAQDNGNGHGRGHNKHDRDDDDDDEHSDHYYKHRDEEAVRGWYSAFLLAWRRKISSLQDWKSNLSVAARCLQGCRSASSPAQWNGSDVCLTTTCLRERRNWWPRCSVEP
jgi:hypothetical protein